MSHSIINIVNKPI